MSGLESLLATSSFPQYAYGLYQAVAAAARASVRSISAVELGVATGNGLLELERIADSLAQSFGVEIRVYGVDTGRGMPAPIDYRDMPYIWMPGFFQMDREQLEGLLQSATLLIGDVADVGGLVLNSESPLGFVAFDLDYYSSTAAAIEVLLHSPPENYLPRPLFYFDDTVGPHEEYHSAYTGELRAIAEYNAHSSRRKIAPINGLRYKFASSQGPWVEGMHVFHVFDHPRYNDYDFPQKDRQFPLEKRHQRPPDLAV